ncbi:DUF1488 domain-containing protein [Hoeflea sp. G2-23]|uniref:DUF1488 domain-containing protein n=1 Tax=Hoeflea algicola TaxID=2983763 RepID=A0ABT3Z5C1_9HYPH|nr:DUF1488 family protein [Hoeflea algicola]MCY0146950.1 DUF1488 domain-containing protein [Hoeflea algicola]
MTLGFPNQTRNIDEDADIIRFSGHDGVMEVRFLMELPALEKMAGTKSMALSAYLTAFDQRREQIQSIADRVYKRSRKSLIRLSVSDL